MVPALNCVIILFKKEYQINDNKVKAMDFFWRIVSIILIKIQQLFEISYLNPRFRGWSWNTALKNNRISSANAIWHTIKNTKTLWSATNIKIT